MLNVGFTEKKVSEEFLGLKLMYFYWSCTFPRLLTISPLSVIFIACSSGFRRYSTPWGVAVCTDISKEIPNDPLPPAPASSECLSRSFRPRVHVERCGTRRPGLLGTLGGGAFCDHPRGPANGPPPPSQPAPRASSVWALPPIHAVREGGVFSLILFW